MVIRRGVCVLLKTSMIGLGCERWEVRGGGEWMGEGLG